MKINYSTPPFSGDHGDLTGLSDDDHSIYALLAGRSGGQTLIGGTASGNGIVLQSTSNATRGTISFGTSGTHLFDEVNSRIGLGTATPQTKLHLRGTTLTELRIETLNATSRIGLWESNSDEPSDGGFVQFNGGANQIQFGVRDSGSGDVILGFLHKSSRAVAWGTGADATTNSTAIGRDTNAAHSNTVVIGTATSGTVSSTASNQVLIGVTSSSLNRFVLDGATGFVGLGITSPARKLHIHDTTSPGVHFTNSSTGTASTDGSFASISGTIDFIFHNQESGGTIRFLTAGSTRFRVASGTEGGMITLGDSTVAVAQVDINNQVAARIGLIVQGHASQSVDIQQDRISTTIYNRRSIVAGGETVFNEQGLDIDFRVESDSAYNALKVDAGNDATHIMDHASGKVSFFGVTAVTRQTELTDELTTITFTAPSTPDYAIQDLTDTGGFGFVTKDEGNTALSVIANLQTRVNELETKLSAYGLLQDAD